MTQEERATVTDSTGAATEQILEPLNSYTVVRLKQDIMTNSNVGMIATYTEHQGRPAAITNGYDWTLYFDSTTYALNGFLALSSTDPGNAHRMLGSAGKLNYGRIAAVHWLWNVAADFTSKEYNINDVGFFFSPNDYGATSSITYKEDIPADVVRNYNVNLFLHYRTNFDKINLNRQAHLGASALFWNYWEMNAGGDFDFGLYDPRETRGNGLYRKPVTYNTNFQIVSDQRSDIWFVLGQQYGWDSKAKWQWVSQLSVNFKPLSWMAWGLESGYQYIQTQEAWFTNTPAGEALFGDRTTHNLSITLRGSITFTRDLTLQLYGQQFFATGHYENYRQLTGPEDFVPYAYSGNPDFNRQSFNSNVVLRWEYLPGSLLYLVWSQARDGGGGEYDPSARNNFEDTFALPPTNVLLLKVSYLLEL